MTRASDTVTLEALQQMKRDGRKIVAVVIYDYQMAQIVERAGVDIVSVGDSVGPRREGSGDLLTTSCWCTAAGSILHPR